jgi:urease accessory protein
MEKTNQSALQTSRLVFIPNVSAGKARRPEAPNRNHVQLPATVVTTLLITLLATTPAFAHHAMGGNLPGNFFEGFLSGVAHPLIGPDHFAFVVAAGLMAVIKPRGILIPIAFVLSAMLGATGHLAGFDLPGVGLLISGSILLFGLLLVLKNRLSTLAVTGLSGLAGLLHGYAYGESIFGAETTPLLAYLIGFTVVQLAIALSAFWIGKVIVSKTSNEQQSATKLRSAGLVICGMGLAFFGSQVIATVFPAPPG